MYIRQFDVAECQTKAGGIHPYHEILIISSGEAMLHYLGNKYEVNSKGVFLLLPNIPHQLIHQSSNLKFYFIELKMEGVNIFPSLEDTIIWNNLQCDDSIKNPFSALEFSDTIESLQNYIEGNYNHFLYTEETVILDIKKFFTLVNNFIIEYRGKNGNNLYVNKNLIMNENTTTQSANLISLMRFMESQYDRNNITLETLAKVVHLNPSYLIRIFKEATGQTPLQYLNNLRMTAATSYLTSTNMSIQEIAEASGFTSIHYFSRLFKEKYGESPTKWKGLK